MSSGSVPPQHDAPSASAAVRVLSDRYRLDEAIGHGGVGVVWRAHDLQLGRQVAVKQLQPGLARDPRASERFRREATKAASLAHPSMVTIFDVGEDEGVPYLVMELVEGPSLADLLPRRGRLGATEVATIGHHVASGLAVVHARGLVHRDVKPGNVLLSLDGVPRLVDFGAVHVRDEDGQDLTTPGTMLGTIGYVAPEQLEGRPVDPRADVYALGLVLWECLTGTPAFGTGTIAELTRRRVEQDVPAPSSVGATVPAVLDQVVADATHRDPDRRPSDAAALADRLAPLVPEDGRSRLIALVAPDGDQTTVMPAAGPPAPPAPVPPEETVDAAATSVLASPPPAAAAPSPPAPPPDTAADADAGDAGRGAGMRLLLPLAGLVALAALIGFIGLGPIGGDPSGTQGSEPADGDGGGGASVVEIVGDGDHDPFGDREHPDDVADAYDGDPDTAWQTQIYNSPTLDKPGVGMWVRAADGTSPHGVEIDLLAPGADVEVYALDDEPGPDPAAWGEPVTVVSDAPGTITADMSGDARVVLVWFTRLPDDGGGHRSGITEIRLR